MEFSNEKWMGYAIKCFGKISQESAKLIPKLISSVDSFLKLFNHNQKTMLSTKPFPETTFPGTKVHVNKMRDDIGIQFNNFSRNVTRLATIITRIG